MVEFIESMAFFTYLSEFTLSTMRVAEEALNIELPGKISRKIPLIKILTERV